MASGSFIFSHSVVISRRDLSRIAFELHDVCERRGDLAAFYAALCLANLSPEERAAVLDAIAAVERSE